MIVIFEGLSKVGKSAIQRKLAEYRKDILLYDGYDKSDVNITDWNSYINYELLTLSKLNTMNPDKIILVDRLMSEYAYNNKAIFNRKLYEDLLGQINVVFITASVNTLKQRKTKEKDICKTFDAYTKLLSSFNIEETFIINTDDISIEDAAFSALKYIYRRKNNA